MRDKEEVLWLTGVLVSDVFQWRNPVAPASDSSSPGARYAEE
jgi:hypothetical protein